MEKKNARLYYEGWDNIGRIKSLSNDNPHPDKAKILDYLVSGEWDGQICSAWNSIFGESESVFLWTDGEWVWDEYLITYFRDKNFKIPDDFLQHMKNNNWLVPKTYELTLFDSHAIIDDQDNTILIDTGAPSTIHSSGRFPFRGLFLCDDEIYSCTTDYAGLTIDKLSELLGMKITTLLGVDILSNYKVMLDYRNNIAKFYRQDISQDIPFEGEECNFNSINGIPIIELEIEQQPIKLFLDTGAKISYLPKEYTSNFESIGIESDFHPAFGKFETECFDIKATFGNKQFNVKFGNLPESLQIMLLISGVNGIIGYDFFNNFKILLDLKNNKMKYATYK